MTDKTAKTFAAALRAAGRFVSRTSVYFTLITLLMYLLNRGAGSTAEYLEFATVFSSFLVFAAIAGAAHFIFDTKLIFPIKLTVHAALSLGAFIVAFIVIPQKSENAAGGLILFIAVYAAAAAAVLIARAIVNKRRNEAQEYQNQIKK
ncbi:MAG: hypothetical protein J5940_03310 [Clostridia bacterium]|nr:hypothetical protein [Clostridia bacterium]